MATKQLFKINNVFPLYDLAKKNIVGTIGLKNILVGKTHVPNTYKISMIKS